MRHKKISYNLEVHLLYDSYRIGGPRNIGITLRFCVTFLYLYIACLLRGTRKHDIFSHYILPKE